MKIVYTVDLVSYVLKPEYATPKVGKPILYGARLYRMDGSFVGYWPEGTMHPEAKKLCMEYIRARLSRDKDHKRGNEARLQRLPEQTE